MRVLVLADICNPEWPSLPVVGFNYAKALAEHADVHVVTQVRNRENIDKVGFGRAQVTYLDTERVAAPIHKLAVMLRRGEATGWTIQMAMHYPSYVAFEHYAWQRFGPALRAGEYDLVHRVTPMSPTLPSAMAGRCPVPFVLGPLNGNLAWPEHFRVERDREREWLSVVRQAYKLLPYHRSTYAKSAAILAAFDHTLADLPAATRSKAINFPEVGIDPSLFVRPERTERDRMTVLYAGRLVPYKLPDVVIRAFAASPTLRRHRLVIAGEGPESPMMEEAIRSEGLQDCVEMLGRVPQARVAELMREADIFAFPSIRELGAGVVVEAMACGLACVVVDYGGPATLIDGSRGIKVPMGDKPTIVKSMTSALETLVNDPDRTARLARAAHDHAVSTYAWDAKARKTVEIYDWVLGRRQDKPEFWQ